MDVLFNLGLILFLVILNGFFVASEISLVSIRKTRVEELVKKKKRSAKLVQGALQDLDRYISATQLGITIASLALGWIGEPIFADFFINLFSFLPSKIAFLSAHSISVAVAFILITFLHVVLGEVAPKTIALKKAETVSLLLIGPLLAFTNIFKPFIWLLDNSSSLLLHVLGFQSDASDNPVHSEEEIRMILAQSGKSGAIAQEEAEMVQNVFTLGDIPIKQIMVPRTDVISVNAAATIAEVAKLAEFNTYSRFPVYENSIDTIVGFVHIKDIYKLAIKSEKDKKLSQTGVIRKILSIPETKKASDVLLDMRKKHIHLAVVHDEYGGTSGIVTLEDVIESVVGEIQDEFDAPLKEIQKQPDGSFLIDGLTAVDIVQRKFAMTLRGQGYATIGGLVFGVLGREPRPGDIVQIGSLVFMVEAMEKKRIKTLRLRKEKK
jgi:CBS domain containing-hemolysin-like protein